MVVEVPSALVRRLDRPGPRYTSYPTANVFDARFGPVDYAQALGRLGRSKRPVALYVHLPFCKSLCHYCACNVIVTTRPDAPSAYLDRLEREADMIVEALGAQAPIVSVHLGGGTPTTFRPPELERLYDILTARFDLSTAEELAVEIDPRVTTRVQLEVLSSLGWNRASFGVQDFDPEVQWAINRIQPLQQTEHVIEVARELGFTGINVDLIYGLPQQRLDGFRATINEVIRIRPDRVALYSYAHVPWLRPAQRRFEKPGYYLPDADEKIALLRSALSAFQEAGYLHLGMDHFALPDDELSRARKQGLLHRNFQGYTVRRSEDLLALGVSAISDIAGVYAQNAKRLEVYEAELDAGRLPTVRGWTLSDEDLLRRRAITLLMTDGRLPAELARQLPQAIERLAPLQADGVVKLLPDGGVEVTELGTFFLRNVAMPFDAHLEASSKLKTFSRTV